MSTCHSQAMILFQQLCMLQFLFAVRDMMLALDKLIKSLGRKAKQFSSYKKVGRTHLMDALPVTLGSEFEAYTTALTVAA